jgi:predicted MFS family arabinose efflux permease
MDSRLLWLALAAFVGAVEGGLIAGQLPLIGAEMGVTIGQAGLLVVGYSLAYAIGTPLLAVLLGGIGRRRILAGAEFGLAVCALLLALSAVFELMVVVRTVLAVAAGTFTATATATAAMLAPSGQRGRYIQVITIGQSIAALVGVPIGAYVATRFSWRINYGAVAAMAAAASLALYLGLPRGMHGDTQTMRERIRVLSNPGIVPALVSTLLFMAGAMPMAIYVGALMAAAGIGIASLPLVFFVGGLGALAASLTAGRLADRVGNRAAAIGMSAAAMTVLVVFAQLKVLPEGLALPVLLAALAVHAYVVWAFSIAVTSESAHLAPSSVPVAISVNMSAFNIAMAIAAAAGGAVVDTWGASVAALGGVPLVLAALLIWVLLPGERRRGADAPGL